MGYGYSKQRLRKFAVICKSKNLARCNSIVIDLSPRFRSSSPFLKKCKLKRSIVVDIQFCEYHI
jgi:hypothetical protein